MPLISPPSPRWSLLRADVEYGSIEVFDESQRPADLCAKCAAKAAHKESDFGRGARKVLEQLHREAERMREMARQAWRDNGSPEDLQHDHAVDTITRQLEALVSRGPWVEDGEGVR